MPPELIHLEAVPSTMEAAHDAAARGAAHGTAIIADRQTAGRGTRGRDWDSGIGGLWFSVIARPSRTEALEALSLRVGLALAAAIELASPALPRLAVKWPNDLLVDGKKLAGILCEARWSGGTCQWVVIGVGVNVANELPAALRPTAARLADWEPGLLARNLAPQVVAAIAMAARSAGPLSAAELAAFAQRDALAGKRLTAPLVGTAEGITSGGALRVRLDSGPVREVLGGVALTPF
jgi:BirA family transcriptional regulator, biotin operon repressor / biotin---[acetyl-CoA-carboxylase] ligase